ncbi:MAG: glutamine synthetase [Theionarchaea archaeon]|nr:glutamine synthetase [Theionarchaea archaeon]
MKQLLDVMDEKKIPQIKLSVVDIEGHPKFMIIPREYLEEAVDGIGIDGSSIPGFTTVDKSDLIAKPDIESAVFLENEVIIFCDVYDRKGNLFEGEPRGILKQVLQRNTFLVKPELEFFLLNKGSPADTEGYMDAAEGLTLITDLISNTDIRVERIHHENGPGQYEIEPLMAPALKACDNIILLKEALRKKARSHGLTATFMPKPLKGVAGSGMHVHVLLEKDGENLFEGFSKTAQSFVGGLLSHARGITALCNPTINSYKRLVPQFEAPVYITWGRGNRSTLVRIPLGGKTRIEYRAPDPSCNPYLALALILGAGLDGIEKKIEPPEEVDGDVFESHAHAGILPSSLKDAITELEGNDLARRILGEHIIREFIELKKEEILNYDTHISQWEFDHYLEK